MTRIEQAQALAHEAHDSIKQVRKYTGEPYWKHTDSVAQIVTDFGGSEDMICAAHLHDVLEDVYPTNSNYSPAVIAANFGLNVATMVAELTDEYTKKKYPKLNREPRKALERERIGKTTPEVKTIKLADLIDNTKTIVEHDKEFAMVYIKEKLLLLPYLSEGNSHLLNVASWQVVGACQKLGIVIPTLG